MRNQNSHFTQVPNNVFDILLPKLTMAELKILLIIIRQTNGWLHNKTKKRKTRDRISHNQFIQKSGLSRRIVIPTIQKLINKELIIVTDDRRTPLHSPTERKGKRRLYYQLALRKERRCVKFSKVDETKPLYRQFEDDKKVSTLKQILKQKTEIWKINDF